MKRTYDEQSVYIEYLEKCLKLNKDYYKYWKKQFTKLSDLHEKLIGAGI